MNVQVDALNPIDAGDHKWLALKWAFDEWRHWLEGAMFQVVNNDHKNLLYIASAQRLNFRQTRWALFFSRFNAVISFQTGSTNLKADALYCSFLQQHLETSVSSPIIPPKKKMQS